MVRTAQVLLPSLLHASDPSVWPLSHPVLRHPPLFMAGALLSHATSCLQQCLPCVPPRFVESLRGGLTFVSL